MLLTQKTLMMLTKAYLLETAKEDSDKGILNKLRQFAMDAKSKREQIETGDVVAIIKCKNGTVYLGTSLSMVDGKPVVMGVDIQTAVMQPICIFSEAQEFFLLEPVGKYEKTSPQRMFIATSLLDEDKVGELVYKDKVYRVSSVAGISFSRIVIGVCDEGGVHDVQAFNISALDKFDFELMEL